MLKIHTGSEEENITENHLNAQEFFTPIPFSDHEKIKENWHRFQVGKSEPSSSGDNSESVSTNFSDSEYPEMQLRLNINEQFNKPDSKTAPDAQHMRVLSHIRSRRNYLTFLKSFMNKAAAIDEFMVLPFCSGVKRDLRQAGSQFSASMKNIRSLVRYYKKSYKRRLKFYKMLERILMPRFKSGRVKKEPILNKFFSNKLRRNLRRLYRIRNNKLRYYLFADRNFTLKQTSSRARKLRLTRYIKKYELQKIFQGYRLRLMRAPLDGHPPLLCIAVRKRGRQRRGPDARALSPSSLVLP
jgi:hypothetical protein